MGFEIMNYRYAFFALRLQKGVTALDILLIVPLGAFALCAIVFIVNTIKHGGVSKWSTFHKQQKREAREALISAREAEINAKMNAQTWIAQLDDCIRLVQSTTNPDVFFSRLETMIERAAQLSSAHDAGYIRLNIDIGEMLPTDAEIGDAVNNFINRLYRKTLNDCRELKTEAGKIKRICAMFDKLDSYYERLDQTNITLLDSLKIKVGIFGRSAPSQDTWQEVVYDNSDNIIDTIVVRDHNAPENMSHEAHEIDDTFVSEQLRELKLSASRAMDEIELHFCFNALIDFTYKHREVPNMLNLCIDYCLRDIELFPQFREAYWDGQINGSKEWQRHEEKTRAFGGAVRGEYAQNRRQQVIDKNKAMIAEGHINIGIPSFSRLAIIYEKQNRIGEAIRICELAISYNLEGGFEGRLERLRRKQLKQG